jgi:hypothetical protein
VAFGTRAGHDTGVRKCCEYANESSCVCDKNHDEKDEQWNADEGRMSDGVSLQSVRKILVGDIAFIIGPILT